MPHGVLRAPRPVAPLERPAQLRRMTIVFVVVLALVAVGTPVAIAVGIAGYIGAFLASPAPLAVSVQQMLHQVDSFVLLAFPLFVLAGFLMEDGGIARRLVDLAVSMACVVVWGLSTW